MICYNIFSPCTCHFQSLLLHCRLQDFQICLLIRFIMLTTFFFSLKPLLLRNPIIHSYNTKLSYSPHNYVELQCFDFRINIKANLSLV
jgi:hypothetical protein